MLRLMTSGIVHVVGWAGRALSTMCGGNRKRAGPTAKTSQGVIKGPRVEMPLGAGLRE